MAEDEFDLDVAESPKLDPLSASLHRNRARAKGAVNTTGVSLEPETVYAGVTVSWLARVWGVRIETARKLLADCPAMGGSGDTKYYDLKTAARYLTPPDPNEVEKYILRIGAKGLPPRLQSDFWAAQNQRLKYLEACGDLWRTEKVGDVLAEALKQIKGTAQLWVDTMERSTELSDVQRKFLSGAVDKLLEDLYRALVEMPKMRTTPSMIAEAEADSGEGPSGG